MRWALASMLLVACYRPSLEHERCVACSAAGDCPGDIACVAWFCGGPSTCNDPPPPNDGRIPDGGGPGEPCLPQVLTANPQSLGLPAPDLTPPTYTLTADGLLAAFKYTPTEIGISAADSIVFSPAVQDGSASNLAPHLSPDGTEIFVHTVREDNQEHAFGVSVLIEQSWSVPSPVLVHSGAQQIVIGAADFPGTPSATTPRRMFMLRDPSVIFELVETTRNSWNIVTTYGPAAFGLKRLYHPQLSADGLRLTFAAENNAGSHAIYVAVRGEADEPFAATQQLFGPVSPRAHPYLTEDCKQVYFYDATVDGIVKVSQRPPT